MGNAIECKVCPHGCVLREGQQGLCRARKNVNGGIVCGNYGKVTALALDPIEKKPLRRYAPGSTVLSVGSYGCNLRCPFCQNYEISYAEEETAACRAMTPEQLRDMAWSLRGRGCIGMAYTYNEPLIGWEFVRDCAKLVHEAGMKNVLVSNGTAQLWVLEEILPYVDAMNIDLKGIRGAYYADALGGDLETVKAFITRAAKDAHMEVTCLIVPGLNDSEEEMRELSGWIASLGEVQDGTGEDIALHVSRFFPRFHMQDREATDVGLIYRLADIARENLRYVYTGNC